MSSTPVTSRTGMSALPQPQDSQAPSAESSFVSSSPRSTSSKRSSRNWYHRSSNRSVPNPAAGQHPNRLRAISSIKDLARKTSRSVLNQSLLNRGSLSLFQTDSNHRHASSTHLPGSPEGPGCLPSTDLAQDPNQSGLSSLTPDQSGISNDPSEPITPIGAQAIQPVIVQDKNLLDQDMGNTDSRFAKLKIGMSFLKGKQSRQTRKPGNSTTPAMVPQQAQEQPEEPASKQLSKVTPDPSKTVKNDEARENVTPVGPPPTLRHRASSGQVQVPRRRSSLTAIHLDSSHFERPVSSTNLNQGDRVSTFSSSFHPVMLSSSSDVGPTSLNTQGDKPSSINTPRPISPSSPTAEVSSTKSSESSGTTPKQSGIYFPQTWPNGPPILKPAQLTSNHYDCYKSHKSMRRERALFNQLPCMTCSIDDKQQRYRCTWCELRVCEPCMKQLDSIKKRPLAKLVNWVAKNEEHKAAELSKNSLNEESGETLKTKKADETPKAENAERLEPEIPSNETVRKLASADGSRPASQSEEISVKVDNTVRLAKIPRDELSVVSKVESSKEAALPTKETDTVESATMTTERRASIERSAGQQAILSRHENMQDIESLNVHSGEESWSETKADQILRDSRG